MITCFRCNKKGKKGCRVTNHPLYGDTLTICKQCTNDIKKQLKDFLLAQSLLK